VLVRTRGERHVWPVSVQAEVRWAIPEQGPLTPFLRLPSRTILPEGQAEDLRLGSDMNYYFGRDFLAPSLPHPEDGKRVLVVALSDLSHDPAGHSLRRLLEQGPLRRRFDEVYVLTLEAGEHPSHPLFERLVERIYHFGAFDFPPGRRDCLVRQLLEGASASDLLIVDSVPGLGLIPHLRESKLPLRITALLPTGKARGPHPPGKDTALYVLASQYAALVDRAATEDEESASWLVNLLFFPRAKLRALGPGEEVIDWLFPADCAPRDHRAELFGAPAGGTSAPRAA
jgi:hypothetical protein